MKVLRKRIALFLVACMVLTYIVPAFASENVTEEKMLSEATESDAAEIATASFCEPENVIEEELEENADSATEEIENATASVSYIDENGVKQTHECILITSQDNYNFTDGGWYAVTGTVSITNRIINEALAKTPAHLILTDGCELNAPRGLSNVVYYAGSGKKVRGLYIYGQEKSTGTLRVTSPERWHAGIGGQGGQPASTLVINGGTIISYGGEEGAGIGNGHSNTNNENITITINGGKIIAVGGKRAAGIGAGHSGYSPNVTINGGIVRARGGVGGAAIGTGYQTQGGNVYINGGDVLADRAREKLWTKDAYPYAIGPGEDARSYGKTYVKDGLTSSYMEYYNGFPDIKPGFFPNNNQVHIKTLKYRVEHYLQNADGTYNQEPDVSEVLIGQKGKLTEGAADSYEGFTVETFNQKTIDDPTPDTKEIVDKEHKSSYQDFGSIMPDPGDPATTSTVVIKYSRKEYTINYDINKPENAPAESVDGFATPASVTTRYGATVSEPVFTTTPSATQYNFGGWYREAECRNKVTFPTEMPLGGATLYAKWIPAQHAIKWMVDDQLDHVTFADYGTYPVYGKANPTKVGSDFLGWQAEGFTELGIHLATGAKTYKAYFSEHDDKSAIVHFDTHGGNYINPIKATIGNAIAAYPTPEKSGFNFGGWYADADCVTPWNTNHVFEDNDNAITLHAKWDYQRPVYWYLKGSGNLVLSETEKPALQDVAEYQGVFDGAKHFAASDDTWEPYKKLIKSVTTDTGNGKIRPLYCDSWFEDCENVIRVRIPGVDTSDTISMESMFSYCSWLDDLGISNFNTANVTDMSYMFEGCTELLSIGFGTGWSTANVTNMNGMFKDCSKLTRLDLSKFSFANVTDLSEFFSMCTALNEIVWPDTIDVSKVEYFWRTFAFCIELEAEDIPVFNAPKVVETEEMFRYCKKLSSVDISGLANAELNNVQRMFEGCSSLRTIYAAEGTDYSATTVKHNSNMFNGCTSIVGGNGQVYDKNIVNNEYARIDKPAEYDPATPTEVATPAKPGYFTKVGSSSQCLVTFVPNNGDSSIIMPVEFEKTVIRPADPMLDNYDFQGWYSDPTLVNIYDFSTKVVKDITLYAKWKISSYSIIWMKDDEIIARTYEEYGKTPAYPADADSQAKLVKTGYIHTGWKDECGNDIHPATESVTYIAQYVQQASDKYYLIFDARGGNFNGTNPLVYTNKAAIVSKPAAPSKEGYNFIGWYQEPAGINEFTFGKSVKSTFGNKNAITLYAKWDLPEAVYYNIKWVDYDGSTLYSVRAEAGTLPVYRKAKPTRNGFIFTGWDHDITLAVKDDTYTATYEAKSTGGGGSSSGGSGKTAPKQQVQPAGAVTGLWTYHADTNKWTFAVGDHNYFDQWAYIYNPNATGNQPTASWFYFDVAGNMLTGWQWIKGSDHITRCYYLNPVSDNTLGACFMGPAITPDGYTVDANGAWTVNGVVQTR